MVPEGLGTALKPAYEPIVVARKPIRGNVAENVLRYGTGALNIDGCRIEASGRPSIESRSDPALNVFGDGLNGSRLAGTTDRGRWPPNVCLDEAAAMALDAMSGERKAGVAVRHRSGGNTFGGTSPKPPMDDVGYGDAGGASRFMYVAKADRAERNAGLDGLPKKMIRWSSGDQNPGSFQSDGTDKTARNHHPTVKPIALMRWLVRLVTPPGGICLDPFMGSGTTGIACVYEERDCILIEKEPEYAEIARRRINHAIGPLFIREGVA